jgi:hypothetical protein
MTEPHQRTRAILKTIKFLESLADPGLALGVPGMTPDVPDGVRFVASELLKDYPTQDEIELIHHALPELFDSIVQHQPLGEPAAPGLTALERESLALLIANDFAALLAQEQPEQAEALLELVADVERASALWGSAWAKGAK